MSIQKNLSFVVCNSTKNYHRTVFLVLIIVSNNNTKKTIKGMYLFHLLIVSFTVKKLSPQ